MRSMVEGAGLRRAGRYLPLPARFRAPPPPRAGEERISLPEGVALEMQSRLFSVDLLGQAHVSAASRPSAAALRPQPARRRGAPVISAGHVGQRRACDKRCSLSGRADHERATIHAQASR